MNGKLGLGVIATLLAVVVGLGIQDVSAVPPSQPTHTLTIITVEREAQVVDLGPPGPSQGDVRVFNAPLHNAEETEVIGRLDGHCTTTDPAEEPSEQVHLTQCLLTFSLPDGHITAQGVGAFPALSELPSPDRYAVTGGTGAYRTARGELASRTQEVRVINTFHLLLEP
jgi:hypothetical protein